MKLVEITKYLESLAPLHLQEDYDNSGLIVGNPQDEITGALVALDCTERIVDEAIEHHCNLIITHHPIVFRGLKRFNDSTYVERVVAKAIRHRIALYAAHTNLDNIRGGVNAKIMERLGIQNPAMLSPKGNVLKKLKVFVPISHSEVVKNALFAAGAGNISNYSECSFSSSGTGTFLPNEYALPTIGEAGRRENVQELAIEVIYPYYKERNILIAMYESHPYEEVAYDIYSLDNSYQEVGAGMIGNLAEPQPKETFLSFLKEQMNVQVIRHAGHKTNNIQRVAVCGGAGSFLLKNAIRAGADVFISSDFKYHEFFDAEDKIMIADIGHFESEQFTQDLLLEVIRKKFPNFAIQITKESTNPIKYYF
ncbi:Nif3-like dinuclear metal center hexameric protein [Albibacterium indicum]|uniref:Nif3-like dinuclear metal center hexameric protein n=1 Tax=Albibacterium indicum TaxID=2292082 RepID=UPI000E4BA808|nr:Nif3-like dinuclear metal center hexameric protein [Pedobacter indicus]